MRAKVCNKYANCGPPRRVCGSFVVSPMIKFLTWQEEGKRLVAKNCCGVGVLTAASCQQTSRQQGHRVSFRLQITHTPCLTATDDRVVQSTEHPAHSSRSPWPHLKLPLQALAQNFHVTRVCAIATPSNRLDKEAKR